MKINYNLLVLLGQPFVLSAQNLTDTITIEFDSLTFSDNVKCEEWVWVINSTETKISKEKANFPIYQNGFDTIVFIRPKINQHDTIITKFSKGSKYTIIYNDCCHSFDIYLLEEYKRNISFYKEKGWEYVDSIKNSKKDCSIYFKIT